MGLLALRACSGMRFRLTPFVFAAGFCASGMRFCDGIAARAGRRRFDARFKSLLRGCGSYAFLACRPGRLLGGFPMQAGCVPARLAGTPLPAGFPGRLRAQTGGVMRLSAFASIVRSMRVKGCGMQGKSLVMLLVVLYASAFLAGFNENLVNMALMSIMGEYGVDSVAAQWLVTGYMIVATIVVM